MGQKVNPISNRLGIIRGWDSNWFGERSYPDNIVEDSNIRKYIQMRLDERQAGNAVSKVVIERTLKLITVTICTSRPGLIIGKGGQEVDKLKEELKKLTNKDIQVNIFEVKKPDLDAQVVGKTIAGRLNGAEMARQEMYKEGRTPLHTFRADIDYCQTTALTKVGLLGIKVWICRGEVYHKVDLAPNYAQQKENGRQGGDRRRGFGKRRNNNR